jgi:outer membrane protein W
MTLKRKWLRPAFVLSMAVGLLLPQVVWGGMWAGVQGGWIFPANSNILQRNLFDYERTYENCKFDSNVFGGVTIGYDFVKEGFLGRAWPGWMKYFSLVVDATYEDVHFKHQPVRIGVKGNLLVPPHYESGISPGGGISMIHINPMIVGRYGIFTSPEISSGRLQPYVGVGPGLVISNLNVDGWDNNQTNKLDMSVLFEGGLRFMVLRNVSVDAAVRYRLVPTQFGSDSYDTSNQQEYSVDINNPRFFYGLVRLSYHF